MKQNKPERRRMLSKVRLTRQKAKSTAIFPVIKLLSVKKKRGKSYSSILYVQSQPEKVTFNERKHMREKTNSSTLERKTWCQWMF